MGGWRATNFVFFWSFFGDDVGCLLGSGLGMLMLKFIFGMACVVAEALWVIGRPVARRLHAQRNSRLDNIGNGVRGVVKLNAVSFHLLRIVMLCISISVSDKVKAFLAHSTLLDVFDKAP